ncbi:MAG: chloride channel protein, partial [Bacteroidales bacterium]|nr:chloride channel protein [Bacteroidales bacterium]
MGKLRSLPEKNRLLILSLVVGLLSGGAAVLLHSLINLIRGGLHSAFEGKADILLYLVLPGVGMLVSLIIVRYLIKDIIGHGVTKVLVAVSKNESRIRPHNMWSSVLTSSLTIGFGGSVGAEAPIVYTGAAIGSNFARYLRMSYRSATILIGCGAAGAIAGIFKAPLAGVLFTLEILLFNISMTSMMPLLL